MVMVCRYIIILNVGVFYFRSPSVLHSQDSFLSTFCPRLWETSSGVVAVGVFAAEALGTVYVLKLLVVISTPSCKWTQKNNNVQKQSLLNNSGLDGRGLSVCWNLDCRCLSSSSEVPTSSILRIPSP